MLRILKRDILRLLKAPAALVVVVALCVLPSLYTWYNVVAFWDPYEATGNLTVCVVNQDAGTEDELVGELDVGALLTEELLKMEQLKFVSKDLDEAMADLEAGRVYAVYVIPEDFSECLVSPLTGTIKKPMIEYYANEKLGPISPKITDTAASTLEETINSMFVEKVSDAVVQAIDDALNSTAGKASQARSTASMRMDAAIGALSQVRDALVGAQASIDEAKAKVDTAASSMDDISKTIDDARIVVRDITDEADAVEMRLLGVASDVSGILPGIVSKAAQIDAEASDIAERLSSLTEAGRSHMAPAMSRLEFVAGALETISSTLLKIANNLPEGWSASGSSPESLTPGGTGLFTAGSLGALVHAEADAGAEDGTEAGTGTEADEGGSGLGASAKSRVLAVSREIGEKASLLRLLLDKTKELDGQFADLSTAAADTANDLKTSARRVADTLQLNADQLYGSAMQSVVSSITRVNAACVRVSAALTELDSTVKQAQAIMRQLSGFMGDGANAIAQTDTLMSGIQTDMRSLASDVRLLADSGALSELLDGSDLNATNISAFLGSPTKVEKVAFYHPNVYGTSMAPLFMNLTFWIGAFMLVIIFKLEVDDEGLRRVTLGQRYLSRLLLFSGFVIVQAIVCCIGVIALGVQVANVPAFLFGSAVAALAYLSIIYALSTSLQHVGKALCIILVFAQIPGGSGLYPLELTDSFFQAIYPFLPFSYGIDVLREAIFGFYGSYYLNDMVVLALIFVSMLVAGMVAVPLMSNVTRMAARQIREGGLYNGEEAVVPARPYRISQVVRALSDRDDYRENLERRYNRFSRLYPILIRVSIVLGIGVPVALMLCMALDAGEKVVLLTVFLLWLVGLVVFLLIVESLRYSFERQLKIDRMSDSKLMRTFFDRDRMRPALAHSTGIASDSNGDAGILADSGAEAGVPVESGADAGVPADSGAEAGVPVESGVDAGNEANGARDGEEARDA